MDKMIDIRITKCRLLLHESEILKLPPEIIKKGIMRGKYAIRADRVTQYYAGGIGNEASS